MKNKFFQLLFNSFKPIKSTEINQQKTKIVAKDEEHLRKLIKKEIDKNGNECDLNHIDITNVTNLEKLFERSNFNGDISQWDTSNVKNMNYMFNLSKFNGNISNWDTSQVKEMIQTFKHSKFNGDISKWDVSQVKDMSVMFLGSMFTGDISNWKPYSLSSNYQMFLDCKAPIPYWADYDNLSDRKSAIDAYHLNKELSEKSSQNSIPKKNTKI